MPLPTSPFIIAPPTACKLGFNTLIRQCYQSILKVFLLCSVLLLPTTAVANTVTDVTAKSLFSDLQKMVYQIRVIDIASGDKYSIGSGFQVSADGHVATNFHVVSSFVHEPDKYRLELEKYDGTKEAVILSAIDVVHDLAIVQSDAISPGFLSLKTNSSYQGDRIYSMGNPQDLGMTIIEGTYNGLLKNSRYQKILFSGSLNAGMSGGPALNVQGEVIGINVSKGGEQISFLVPVEHLRTLLKQAISNKPLENANNNITVALLADQEQFYQALLNNPLDLKTLGRLLLPGKLAEPLKCWGHSVEEDIKYEAIHKHCTLKDEIYISGDIATGSFFYDYEWITSSKLNRLQFYTLLETRFEHIELDNAYTEEDISEYRCKTDLVELKSGTWKVSSCLRAYLKYKGLNDALLVMALVDHNDQAGIVKVGASGISRGNALSFFKHMMEAIEWTP